MDSILASSKAWLVQHLPHAVRIAIILLAATVLVRVARKVLLRIEKLAEDDDPSTVSEREKRAKTLNSILRQFISVIVWGVSGMLDVRC